MLDIRLTEDQYDCLVDDLLLVLTRETGQKIPENLTIKQKRWLIDALLEVRAPGDISETVLTLQNKLLSFENFSRGVMNLNQFKFVLGVATIDFDLTCVQADVCVMFSPALVCALDEQTENEKRLLNAGGVQVKESFSEILQEYHNVVSQTKAYIVNAGNLPYKKLAKILVGTKQNVGPVDCAAFDMAVKDLVAQMQSNNLKSVLFDLKSLYQIDPALVEIVRRNFKQFKKLKIKIIKNL